MTSMVPTQIVGMRLDPLLGSSAVVLSEIDEVVESFHRLLETASPSDFAT
ncbi:MAG: hypothetical protein ACI9N0_000582 [Ilumatobacter sp.]|jgi:hypothetical protein